MTAGHVGEESEHRAPEDEDERHHEAGGHHVEPRGDVGRALAALEISRAVVLAHEGRGGKPEGVDEAVDVDLDREGRNGSGHGVRAETVDGGLDDKVRNREDRALQPAGQPILTIVRSAERSSLKTSRGSM